MKYSAMIKVWKTENTCLLGFTGKYILDFVKACFWISYIFCNYDCSLLYNLKKSRKPFLTVNDGSDLKSAFYKNILEFFKATFSS